MKRIANKLWAVAIGIVLSIPVVAIAQDYFEASGIPVQRSAISSAQFRTEFSNIETKISDKLPALAGNGDNWVRVNAGGTALTSLTDAATVTALGVPSVGSSATITGAWTFENQLDIDNGNSLRIYDSTDTDFANFSHDGADFNLAFTTTTDWNITGITTLAAGAVNADFAAITATTYGGITEANLVDKSAAETIAGAWTLPVASITAHEAAIDHDALSNFVANEHLDWTGDLGATNLHVNNAANGVLALAAGEVTQLSNIGATTITAGDWTAVAALVGTNTGDQTITLSGDVTGSGTGSFAATIAADAVTMDKIADIATDTFLGRVTASTGTVEVLSNAQAKTALDLTGTNSGDQTITLTGNVTGSGTGSFAATIANDAVSLAKMANMATASFLGRNTAATGDPEVLSATTARSILNVENGSTADQTSIVGISGTKAQFDTAVSDGNIAYTGGAHHDGFSDFVANEHLDWTSDLGATNLHRGNVQEFGSAATGGVPASGGGTDNYLRADGTWASPPGGGGEINDLTAAVTWTNVPNANITQASVTQHQAAINHDALSGFVANEHLDWTADLGATNLHSGNSANSVLALTSGEVTQLANIGATVISAADWTAAAALVGTNTGDEAAASLTVQGIVELATIAET
ncbi:MAG: hypothetical protein IIB77_00540, partial [Proteobacteria bacterium]|nr:hypothetical protein [Pseudomonadota bacterium]